MITRRQRTAINTQFRTERFDNFGGTDISSSNDSISNINTPDQLNMLPNNKGDLSARKGIKTVYHFGLGFGSAPVNGWTYKSGAVIHNGNTFYFGMVFL